MFGMRKLVYELKWDIGILKNKVNKLEEKLEMEWLMRKYDFIDDYYLYVLSNEYVVCLKNWDILTWGSIWAIKSSILSYTKWLEDNKKKTTKKK